MAKNDQRESLAANLKVTSGLQSFRSVASGPAAMRDSPFGRPVSALTQPSPVAEKTLPEPPKPVPPEPAPANNLAHKLKSRPELANPIETIVGDDVASVTNEEKVTVPLSQELRDQSEELARVINRTRSDRKNRITRNSIIRVALQCFLEDFSLPPGRVVGSEEELLVAARSRKKRAPTTRE